MEQKEPLPNPINLSLSIPAEPHWNYVDAVAISEDANTAVTVSRDSLRVWSIPSGEARCVINFEEEAYASRAIDQPSDVVKLLVTKDGQRAITGLLDGRLRVYNLAQCKLLQERAAHQAKITALLFVKDNLISASADGNILVWNKAEAQSPSLRIDVGGPVRCLAVDKLAEKIAVGYQAQEFGQEAIYLLSDGKKLLDLKHPDSGAATPSSEMLFTPDNQKLVLMRSFSEQKLELWSTATGEIETSFLIDPLDFQTEHHGLLAGFVDADTLLAFQFEGAVFFDLKSGKAISQIPLEPKVLTSNIAQSRRWGVARSGDDWLAILGDQNGNIALFSLQKKVELFHIDRSNSKKISKKRCAAMIDTVLALTKTAKETQYWELPDPQRFASLVSTGKEREDLINDCAVTVSEIEYQCTVSKKIYDDLEECNYFRLLCEVDACRSSPGGRLPF
jgi:hypothetical protein